MTYLVYSFVTCTFIISFMILNNGTYNTIHAVCTNVDQCTFTIYIFKIIYVPLLTCRLRRMYVQLNYVLMLTNVYAPLLTRRLRRMYVQLNYVLMLTNVYVPLLTRTLRRMYVQFNQSITICTNVDQCLCNDQK